MPLISNLLELGLLAMFQEQTMPTTASQAGQMLAAAYVAYATPSAPTAATMQSSLANLLATAFNPAAPTGAALFISALAVFWAPQICTPVAPTATACLFTPTGDTSLKLSVDDASPSQQAKALANALHTLTLSSVKVLFAGPPPGSMPIS